MVGKGRLAGVVLVLVAAALIGAGCSAPARQRHGMVIGIPAEHIGEYQRLHADTRPAVLEVIEEAKIRNYSIFLGEIAPDDYYLFGYYEYVGRNHAADETMQKWWQRTDPLQQPLETRAEGEWWARWEEVFHHDGPAYEPSEIKSRHGSIVGLHEEHILAYTQMHAAVWPGVLDTLDRTGVRNYSIFLGRIEPGKYLLFSYFEYVGDDFAGDMEDMADEVTKLWWNYTDPLQSRLPGTPQGQQWKAMEQVFYTD